VSIAPFASSPDVVSVVEDVPAAKPNGMLTFDRVTVFPVVCRSEEVSLYLNWFPDESPVIWMLIVSPEFIASTPEVGVDCVAVNADAVGITARLIIITTMIQRSPTFVFLVLFMDKSSTIDITFPINLQYDKPYDPAEPEICIKSINKSKYDIRSTFTVNFLLKKKWSTCSAWRVF
jgi:hypothetical protein